MNLIYQLKWKLLIPKLKKIKLIVFDVDGVLTDGGGYGTTQKEN